MKQDFLRHDVYASHDPKIVKLINERGAEGYGVFWLLIEYMYISPDHVLHLDNQMFDGICRRLDIKPKTARAVVEEYDLFRVEGTVARNSRVDRAMDEWSEYINRRRDAGRKGGLASGKSRATTTSNDNKAPASTNRSKRKENKIKEKKIKEKKDSSAQDAALSLAVTNVIIYFNQVTGKSLKTGGIANRKYIRARLNEGFTQADCEKVIRVKNAEWRDSEKMSKFIRIETLFGSKFESYLQQQEVKPKTGIERYINDD